MCRLLLLILVVSGSVVVNGRAVAAAPGCGQAQVEKLLGAPAPPQPSDNTIYPRQPVTPFYQWESNNGYCGEVSLITAGLLNGQWMGQFDARLICGAFFGPETAGGGASLLQAGNPLRRNPNYNAQLLIEKPGSGVSGPEDFAHAALCASNARLRAVTYPYTTGFWHANSGLEGYRDYMRWIKAQVIAGNQVTVAVLFNGGADAQYDHEVSVLKIGTRHAPTDDAYYPDDVLYFEDHGAYTLIFENGKWSFAGNPSVPHGAGNDSRGCTPYVFAYTFESLAKTRAAANAPGAGGYSIVIPGEQSIKTGSGNSTPSGTGEVTIEGPHNYALSVTGPTDPQRVTLPILLRIVRTESLQGGVWTPNPWDTNSEPAAGNNYETPYIGGPVGTCNAGQCVTNTAPAEMLVTLQATVSGLTPGTAYNLYEYELAGLTGADTGTGAALPIPIANFNAHAQAATSTTRFVATGPTYTSGPIQLTSAHMAVFRAVADTAP